MTSLLKRPSVAGQGEPLHQPPFKGGPSQDLAVAHKTAQDFYPQGVLNKRVEFEDTKSNTSEGTEWKKTFAARRTNTAWSTFSQASTAFTDATEPEDPLSPITASFGATNFSQYSSSPSLVESRCGSPAPATRHPWSYYKLETDLENQPVDMTTGLVNFTAEGSSLPKHNFSPCLKPRRIVRDPDNIRKGLQDPARHLPKFRRRDSMGKDALFQVGRPSDAIHPEGPSISQITAGLRAGSAGDSKVVLPVHPKEEFESLVELESLLPDAEPLRSPDLPDLQGMQIDEAADQNMKKDTTKEVPRDVDTPTTGNGSSPEGLSPLIMTPCPDEPEDTEASQSPILDSGLIQDVCEQILRQAFGTEYDDIAHTDAAEEAYNTVSYCLDELSRILPDDSLFGSSICIQELPRGAGHIAPTRQEGSGPNSGMGYGGGASNGSQKRPNDDGDGYPSRGPEDGSGHGDRGFGEGGNDGGYKRARMTADPEPKLSCPFRKRNPEKFNIRDHQSCAVQHHKNISLVKRHIKTHHKQITGSLYPCPRCGENMPSPEAVQAHLAVPSDRICSPQEGSASRNPEDGIMDRHESLLNNRKAHGKIDNWQNLWQNLFPSDDVVPEPDFEPPVEREEFYRDLQNSRAQLVQTLSASKKLEFSENQQPEQQRVGQLVDLFYGHIDQVFENSRRQPLTMVHRQRSGRRNARAESSISESPISPVSQKQGRGQSQLAVPRPIVNKRVTNGDSNGGSLASSLETINSAESWANVGQAELMVTRAPPGLTGSGNIPLHQGQFAQTGVGVVASPLGPRQSRQNDLPATPSPVTPRTPINAQVVFGVYGNGVVNLSQPAQVPGFPHSRQDVVDSGIEMVNHCPPAQGMNGLNNIHRADARGMFGPSSQPQQHRPAEMGFGVPLPQHLAYQQQWGHMEVVSPDDSQMVMGEMYASDFDWGLNGGGMDLLRQQYQGGSSDF
ncbi:hypothetical protein QBC32DRAFT_11370 [Pseudoneurospora amorphoporcata]|uniref:C2H2-type domain-containing protein n=1 Tax=Pseudoneurospora amorphoporcata TaxID=241081 RepID=A0AAN6NR63_9PEZI|nr:hypothetical protein QBC32DRAFT_11370 [Pseudoneurospora amorphoporcata]